MYFIIVSCEVDCVDIVGVGYVNVDIVGGVFQFDIVRIVDCCGEVLGVGVKLEIFRI